MRYKTLNGPEAVGFEPTSHVLAWLADYKSAALGHYATPPGGEMRVEGFEPSRCCRTGGFKDRSVCLFTTPAYLFKPKYGEYGS